MKVRKFERTVYKVYLAEYTALPDNQKSWAQHRHLAPFTLQSAPKVTVTR